MTQPAVESWADTFSKREEELTAGPEPLWLRSLRKAAFARVLELGLPTRRQEAWKYTSLAPLEKLRFRPAGSSRAPDEVERLWPGFPFEGMTRLVFWNGHLVPGLSRSESAGPGVRLLSLRESLGRDPASLEALLQEPPGLEAHPFAALNTAFFQDGAVLVLGRDVRLSAPILLVFASGLDGPAQETHTRVAVRAAAGSVATLVELHVSGAGDPGLHTNVTELVLSENAELRHVRLQGEHEEGFHFSVLEARQERDSRLHAHEISLGGGLVRNDVVVRLEGPGAECTLSGLYALNGRQHVDNHTCLDHCAPHTSSRELYKGILAGSAHGVFQGRIVVRPQAQKTNAHQKNDNLLLSPGAEVDTKPQLEIHADDVKCSHGSTIGHLQEEALFYLRSRGLDGVQAGGLLTRGFAAEMVEDLPLAAWREPLLRRVLQRTLGAEASP